MKQDSNIHRWEVAGHGKAPFRCVGVAEIPSKSLAEKNPDAYNNAMKMLPKGYAVGTCGVCGMALSVNYLIESADGKKFSVGCECVKKSTDANLIKETDAKRLARDRAKRKEKREARQRERTAEHEARLEKQRKKNGGLTDHELEQKKRHDALKKRGKILKPLAQALRDGKGGFRDCMANDMEQGELPAGRGRNLVIEIIAKQSGRTGSAAYGVKAREVAEALDKAECIIL